MAVWVQDLAQAFTGASRQHSGAQQTAKLWQVQGNESQHSPGTLNLLPGTASLSAPHAAMQRCAPLLLLLLLL